MCKLESSQTYPPFLKTGKGKSLALTPLRDEVFQWANHQGNSIVPLGPLGSQHDMAAMPRTKLPLKLRNFPATSRGFYS